MGKYFRANDLQYYDGQHPLIHLASLFDRLLEILVINILTLGLGGLNLLVNH